MRVNIHKSLGCLAILLLLFSFFSCSRQAGVKNIIHEAGNIIEQQPDSALQMLNTILFPEDLNKSLFNKYHLLLVQAKDKNSKDIASDTVIFEVKDYYIRKQDYPNAARAAFYCGQVLHEQKNVEKATEAYLEAEKLANMTEDYNLKGLIYGNLGILYRENSSYEKAIALNKKAVAMYDRVKNYRNIINASCLIGDCFVLSKKIDSAFYYYNESLVLAESCKMIDLQLNIKNNMGIAYREQGFYEQAKKHFIEALSFPTDSVAQARILLNIAQVFVLENKMDSVKFYLDKASLLQIQDPWLLRSSNRLLSLIEEKNNNYQEALKYYKAYYHSTIELLDENKGVAILEIQKKYDFEKNKNSNNQLIVKQQKTLILLSVVLLVAGIVSFIFYRKNVQNRRILQETEEKIIGLQKIAQEALQKNESYQNLVLQRFNVLNKVVQLESEITEQEQKSGQKLFRRFRKIVYGQDALNWNELYKIMNSFRNGLYDKVKERYPQWNEIEFCVFCLTCEHQFDDDVIAVILDKTTPMVRKIRNKIRTELGMPKYCQDFIAFIEKKLSIEE